MVVVPARDLGDFLLANRANAVLFFPRVDKLPSPAQTIDHLQAKPSFKVDFPSLRDMGATV